MYLYFYEIYSQILFGDVLSINQALSEKAPNLLKKNNIIYII